jgi:hypothetical protein
LFSPQHLHVISYNAATTLGLLSTTRLFLLPNGIESSFLGPSSPLLFLSLSASRARIALSSYFESSIAVQWLDRVVRIVGAHEEQHPVCVSESLALDNLAIVTAVAHRSVDPLRHHNHLFSRSEQLQVQLRT